MSARTADRSLKCFMSTTSRLPTIVRHRQRQCTTKPLAIDSLDRLRASLRMWHLSFVRPMRRSRNLSRYSTTSSCILSTCFILNFLLSCSKQADINQVLLSSGVALSRSNTCTVCWYVAGSNRCWPGLARFSRLTRAVVQRLTMSIVLATEKDSRRFFLRAII